MLEHEELAHLRHMLEKRKAALVRELRSDAARVRDESFGALAGEVKDTGDESVADLIADVDQAELSRDLHELRDIEAALGRFVGGGYGVCDTCEADIAIERLHAQPAALRCVPCQNLWEKTHAQPGHAKL